MLLPCFIIFLSFTAFCFTTLASAAILPDGEVQALQDIGESLGKKDWNFSVDPCSTQEGWVNKNAQNGFETAVDCDCFYSNGTVCHVVSIMLKGQDLPGVLPPDFSGLPFLQQIDLSRNYLSGSIPPEWGSHSLPLVNITLLGNRLTGSIPKTFGNLANLTSLVVDVNHLSGDLPAELGNLPNLERLLLTSNNFSGELPATFANLTTLKDLRISDNHFTGPIPDFIEKWTNLEKLVIHASGLVGPIPSTIASLIKLTDLRISDLNGTEQALPPLGQMAKMKTLILRSCNIKGKLPDYLGQMTTLKVLDLGFNKINGVIPSNFGGLLKTDYIYLTGNLLTGPIPSWMLEKGDNIDLSYNSFTAGNSVSHCQQQNVNLFASSSKGNNVSGIVPCLGNSNCTKTYYNLHINCGGRQVTINRNTTFEDDTDRSGPSTFFRKSGGNWGFSSTGHFLDDNTESDFYIQTNTSRLLMKDSQLFTESRISPLSLTYYGFCMGNGKYTVNLHFAETMFTDNKTYRSLGRRIFDVYVQGKLVLKDFNIEDAAGGVGKEIVKSFSITVTNKTLEIRFYWAGKGTTAIPDRGVYGPLISAISVNPNFIPPAEEGSRSSSNTIPVGTVVGIAVGVLFAIILVVGFLWWKGCFRSESTLEQDLKGLDLHTGSFSLRQIKSATNNFDVANKIGEGGFGPVYKGHLADGTAIAVKQLSSKSKQGNREFITEIGMISALQHPNLVKLYGCCIEGNQLMLIYEYLENNSLARALFGPEELRMKLDWPTRHRICIGIARGLAYLHEESRLKIVHRDIKATNVLLDKDLNPKISDFGLAKLDEEDNTHISTRVAGTFGYMAPEYAMRGHLTDKADVYSFGIVALEIVSGRSNSSSRPKGDTYNLLDWSKDLKEQGNLLKLVDPCLGSDFDKEQVMAMINVALLCSDVSPSVRPLMSSVVSMLEGRAEVEDFVPDSSVSNIDETKSEAMRKYYQFSIEQSDNGNQTHSMSIDGPSTGSSTSAIDLYPVSLNSEYLKNRV